MSIKSFLSRLRQKDYKSQRWWITWKKQSSTHNRLMRTVMFRDPPKFKPDKIPTLRKGA